MVSAGYDNTAAAALVSRFPGKPLILVALR
jgi:hypothetical protein